MKVEDDWFKIYAGLWSAMLALALHLVQLGPTLVQILLVLDRQHFPQAAPHHSVVNGKLVVGQIQ
jgi:hypothetical protein